MVSIHSWPSEVNATRPASGERAGNEMPLTMRSLVLSKSRRRRMAGRLAVTRSVASKGTLATTPRRALSPSTAAGLGASTR
jgi:hypothetical protein